MANFVYTNFKYKAGKKSYDLSVDALKVALFLAAYTPNQDTDTGYSLISANEVAAGNGYTAGGIALASQVWAADNANHRSKLTANNLVWNMTASITYRYAVLYHVTSGDLASLFDPGASQVGPTSGTININWDATNGVLTLT